MNTFVVCVLIIAGVNCRHVNNNTQYEDQEQQIYIIHDEFGNPQVIDLKQKPRYDIVVNKTDIGFYMFTRWNVNDSVYINPEEFDGSIKSAHFKPHRSNYFLTHGYTDSFRGATINRIKTTLLEAEDLNVFIIDWSPISQNEFYTTAVEAVDQMSVIIGEVIEKLMNNYHISFSKINLSGHSLGAHIIGATGAYLRGRANLIVATDPAMPLFNHDETDRRLDPTDAQFVQVIHTNAGLLGFIRPIGHADYYPNGGGINQPGCGTDLIGVCAHERAQIFFIESIASSGFRAKACDAYEDFKNGLCDYNEVSYMGEYLVDKSASGKYYLDTAAESPFALD